MFHHSSSVLHRPDDAIRKNEKDVNPASELAFDRAWISDVDAKVSPVLIVKIKISILPARITARIPE
jgi:hypothetical protein